MLFINSQYNNKIIQFNIGNELCNTLILAAHQNLQDNNYIRYCYINFILPNLTYFTLSYIECSYINCLY